MDGAALGSALGALRLVVDGLLAVHERHALAGRVVTARGTGPLDGFDEDFGELPFQVLHRIVAAGLAQREPAGSDVGTLAACLEQQWAGAVGLLHEAEGPEAGPAAAGAAAGRTDGGAVAGAEAE